MNRQQRAENARRAAEDRGVSAQLLQRAEDNRKRMEAALQEVERNTMQERTRGGGGGGSSSGGVGASAAPLLRKWQRQRREVAAERAFEREFLPSGGAQGQGIVPTFLEEVPDEMEDEEVEEARRHAAGEGEGVGAAGEPRGGGCKAETAADGALRLVARLRAEEERLRATQLRERGRQLQQLQRRWQSLGGGGGASGLSAITETTDSGRGSDLEGAEPRNVVEDLISEIPEVAPERHQPSSSWKDDGSPNDATQLQPGVEVPQRSEARGADAALETALRSAAEEAAATSPAPAAAAATATVGMPVAAVSETQPASPDVVGGRASSSYGSLTEIVRQAREAVEGLSTQAQGGANVANAAASQLRASGRADAPASEQHPANQQQQQRRHEQKQGVTRSAVLSDLGSSTASLSEIMRQAEEVLRQLPEDMRASLARRPGSTLSSGGLAALAGSLVSSVDSVGASSAPGARRQRPVVMRGFGLLPATATDSSLASSSVGGSLTAEAAAAELAAIAAESAALTSRASGAAPEAAAAASQRGGEGRGAGRVGGGATVGAAGSRGQSDSLASSGVLSEGADSVVRELRALEKQLGLQVSLG